MKVSFLGLMSAVAILVGITPIAVAQDGEPLARFENWDLHVFEDADGKTCVVASHPIDSQPTNILRSEILFMVTDFPADGAQNEIHVEMGYPLDSPVSVNVDDGPTFTMTWGWEGREGAWFENEVENDLLITAMKRGQTMVIRARSTRGTNTIDTYSLIGITAALARAAEECT